MTGQDGAEQDRAEYVRRFVLLARTEVADLLTRYGGRLDDFGVDGLGSDGLGSAGDTTVHAEAVLTFRGRRFRYRRRVWPNDHPFPLSVSLYVTHLQERLLTRTPPTDAAEPVTL